MQFIVFPFTCLRTVITFAILEAIQVVHSTLNAVHLLKMLILMVQ